MAGLSPPRSRALPPAGTAPQISGSHKGGTKVRTIFRLLGTVIAVLGLTALLVAPADAATHGKGKYTLRIAAEEIQSEFLDLGPAGPSLGDELVFSERLYRNRREVGVSG